MIRLHNSLSRELEDFQPLDPSMVTMYVCGPTVYDTPHIGNARPAVIFDVLHRLLREEYGVESVQYARNYTDIDDKIMERAAANGETISALTSRTVVDYEQVMADLSVMQPKWLPRATEYIAQIIDMISAIIDNGYAYSADGHVMFDVVAWPTHGLMTGHKQENLDAGNRVAVADYKRSPGDFILWKPSTDDQPGWDSPWGRGRPGWHIECTAMIQDVFGDAIDIHGGGADLRFPHHECEISQYGAFHNHPKAPAKYWLHNGMITVDGQKMAKSAGNFITAKDAIEIHGGQVVRLALLSTQYRSNLDWTDELLAAAHRTLTGWHEALETVVAPAALNEHSEAILGALRADLNTPLAITRIHEKIGTIAEAPEEIAAGVRYAANVLGLKLDEGDHDVYLRGLPDRVEIEELITARIQARAARDFAASDRIRQQLVDRGLAVEDGPRGVTKWRRA